MKHLIELSMAVLLTACGGSSQIKPGSDEIVSKPGVLSVQVNWVKDKKTKYDLNISLRNDSTGGIIVFLSDLQCNRGDVAGKFRHTFFNTGERTIDFHPGQMKNFNAVCDLNTKSTGDYVITVKKVYANDSLDGKTAGKVIAEDIVWHGKDK